MRVTTCQQILSDSGGTSAKRAENIATELRKAGLLPKGGRGFHAPHIDFREAAIFALTVAGADTVALARKVALRLPELINKNNEALVDVLAGVFAGSKARDILNIRLYGDAAAAEVTVIVNNDVRIERFMPHSELGVLHWSGGLGDNVVGRIGHIGRLIIRQMADAFGAPDDTRWMF